MGLATKPQKTHLKWVSGSLESGDGGLTRDWCLKTHSGDRFVDEENAFRSIQSRWSPLLGHVHAKFEDK